MNTGKLTIVMYHYVRDIRNSAYPRLKGLDIPSFKRQLDFLQANYTMARLADIKAYIKDSKPLPDKACWLTFDDGYRDHYEYVFPELLSRGIEGAFFPPSKPITDREILDVNKIHFILASISDVAVVVKELRAGFWVNDLSQVLGKTFDELWNELAKPNRFDSGEIIFVKRMLQHALPPHWRRNFADLLFAKYVSADAQTFADNLYMSSTQLSEMAQSGMYVGSHGYRHLWLGKETYMTQLDEIEKSLEFLKKIGAPISDWVMCYPYGDYNTTTLDILKSKGCLAGLTTKVGIAGLPLSACLQLPRLDTNDLPQ